MGGILALAQLLEIGAGVGLDLLSRQLNTGCTFARGVTDARGEVANDQNRGVARILEGPQLAEEDRVTQVNVTAGRIDAELDPQGTPLLLRLGEAGGELLVSITGFRARGEEVSDTALQPLRQSPLALGHVRPAVWGRIVRRRRSGFGFQLALHAVQGALHLLKHLIGGHPELAELGAELLHGELGLEVIGELKALHEDAVAVHQRLHPLDEELLAFPIELAVLPAQLHQLLVVAEQALGFLLNDLGFKERHHAEPGGPNDCAEPGRP